MRLLKLIAYAVLGYVIYELYRGMTEGSGERAGEALGERRRGSRGARALGRALNENPGRMNITGGGRGTTVSTDDPHGGHTSHVVGRGVVSDA